MSQKKPLISIGIPFFNAEKYLALAIQSVLYQTYTHWELFLVDDGSSDKSLITAKNYATLDSRIKVISDGKNLGLPQRLNELSYLATGKYYARMDADDIMHPNRLEKQVYYLQEHQEIDLVGSGLISIDNNNRILGLRKGITKECYNLKDIIAGAWCAHPTIMGKTSWFKQHTYDVLLERAQDYDLWIRTIETSRFSKLPEPYLYYREASTSTIKKYIKASNHTRQIFWKNNNILGLYNSCKMTLINYLKLLVYIFFWMMGLTNSLIKRRYSLLKKNDILEHKKNINRIVASSLDSI
jgi:glycosyltransferase involved in cell wall biosynthesis